MFDYHIHTRYSVDGQGEPEEFCNVALTEELVEIGFSDHFDVNPEDASYGFFALEPYLTHVRRCQETYEDRLKIRIGLEVGEPHNYSTALETLLDRAQGAFDYLIGSVHWYNQMLIGNPAHFHQLSPRQSYHLYFEEVLRMVRHGGFQILGHLDLVSRYPINHPLVIKEHEEIIREILRTALAQGIVPEINLSGLRRKVSSSLPPQEVLEWYRELGGDTIALGSDAHRPSEAGSLNRYGMELARQAGLRYVAAFSQGELKPTLLP